PGRPGGRRCRRRFDRPDPRRTTSHGRGGRRTRTHPLNDRPGQAMKVNTAPPAARTDGDTVEVLLAAVPARLRPHVRTLLGSPRLGGRGLRAWLSLLEVD